jgi:NADPH:quinone reductase
VSSRLIAAGAGAVGRYAVQMAKLRGAYVVTTVSNEAKAAHARAAGADDTINYRTENVGERVMAVTHGQGADALIEMDLSGNAALYPAILRPHATVVVYGTSASEAALPVLWLMQNSVTLRLFLVYELSPEDRAAGLAQLTDLLEHGQLIHTVARRLPLEAIAEAHEIVERGAVIGNVILDIP